MNGFLKDALELFKMKLRGPFANYVTEKPYKLFKIL
jgi:hypothetical protein